MTQSKATPYTISLFLHNIRSVHNVASIFRTADCAGVHKIFVSGYTPIPPRPDFEKVSLGAENFVLWERFFDAASALQKIKNEGFTLTALEQTHKSQNFLEIMRDQIPKKICVTLGSERTGTPEFLLEQIDIHWELPQWGQKKSLNVSCAAAAFLFAFRQKIA